MKKNMVLFSAMLLTVSLAVIDKCAASSSAAAATSASSVDSEDLTGIFTEHNYTQIFTLATTWLAAIRMQDQFQVDLTKELLRYVSEHSSNPSLIKQAFALHDVLLATLNEAANARTEELVIEELSRQ